MNDVAGGLCSGGETMQPGGRCPEGCDHADHYANDGHPECEDNLWAVMERHRPT